MIILKNTNEKIRVVLGQTVTTNQIQCFASFRNRTDTTFSADSNFLITNNTTSVDLVTSPIADSQKIIDYMSFYNNDTTQKTITISLYDGTNEYILFKSVIAAGEKIEYQEGKGFEVFTTVGSKKLSINQGVSAPNPSGMLAVTLRADVVNNNAVANTISNVTGLSVSLLANNVYYFKFIIYYTAQATITGSRWCVNADAGLATNLSLISEYSLTTTTTTRNALIQGFDLPAASNASSATTVNNMAILEGYFRPTADCTFTARFASEVANSAITAKAGSVLYYQELT